MLPTKKFQTHYYLTPAILCNAPVEWLVPLETVEGYDPPPPGALPTMAYTERLRPKGVPFSATGEQPVYLKGTIF